MLVERLMEPISRFVRLRSLQSAIEKGNWERVGALSDSLRRSEKQKHTDLISAYRVVKLQAQQRGDIIRVEEVDRIIGQTIRRLDSPELLEQSS